MINIPTSPELKEGEKKFIISDNQDNEIGYSILDANGNLVSEEVAEGFETYTDIETGTIKYRAALKADDSQNMTDVPTADTTVVTSEDGDAQAEGEENSGATEYIDLALENLDENHVFYHKIKTLLTEAKEKISA